MIVSFFEEFPKKENFDKLKLVKWSTKLHIAAKSLKEFNQIKSKIKNKNIKEFIYWPILGMNEGYWISPFSKRHAMLSVFNELKGKKVSVMIDAETPFSKHNILFITQLFNFFRNRKIISKFIKNYPNVYVSEYYPQGKIKDAILSFLGLHFDPHEYNVKVIKMVYHSMHRFNEKFITKALTEGRKKYGKNFLVGYGTLAPGITGDEPKLSLLQLKKDMEIAKKAGLSEVVIYRLGGLNKKYASLFRKFST